MKKAVVISASSDIGAALCQDWIAKGWDVLGTYRTTPPPCLSSSVYCDLLDPHSIQETVTQVQKKMPSWDVLTFAPGTLNPIGRFEEVDFLEWEQGLEINLLRPLKMLHALLPSRAKGATVLFFAGAGSNGAAPNYSAYALSKVALIKMCELLDAEMPDVRFVIVGPGWVKTKIHQETLDAQCRAGNNLQQTLDRLKEENFTSMQDVIACCHWLITSTAKELGGRNYSVVHDHWGDHALEKALNEDSNLYKLRREGNALKRLSRHENID